MAFVDVDPKRVIAEDSGTGGKYLAGLSTLQNLAFEDDPTDWRRWRIAYEGGDALLDEFLQKFSTREKNADYLRRKKLSPVANFAKTAVNNIRNAIFQRMDDVTRDGGSSVYKEAVAGEKGGVDRRDKNMNTFMGKDILTDLILMGKVGIYVDAPKDKEDGQETLLDSMNRKPYLYMFGIEDIRAFTLNEPGHPSKFKALLLRETTLDHDETHYLPIRRTSRYRYVRLEAGKVVVTYFTPEGDEIETVRTDLERIPFVLLDAGGSVMKDVLQHQIAILNIDSANTNYAMMQNFPKWVEKRSRYGDSPHLRPAANADGTATAGGQGANEETIEVGEVLGRTYPEEAPRYVTPPSESLLSNIQLREKYEEDINKLAHQAVSNLATSSENPFESGLAFLGKLLQLAENMVADFWSVYEKTNPRQREKATVEYPQRWNLRTEEERLEEAERLAKLVERIPGRKGKKKIAEKMLEILFGGSVSSEEMAELQADTQAANYTTSDPDVVKMAVEQGLVGNQTASVSLGYDDEEYKKAQEDRAERIALTREAQSSNGELQNPAARGVDDEAVMPGVEAAEEKEVSRQTDDKEEAKPPVRGEQD